MQSTDAVSVQPSRFARVIEGLCFGCAVLGMLGMVALIALGWHMVALFTLTPMIAISLTLGALAGVRYAVDGDGVTATYAGRVVRKHGWQDMQRIVFERSDVDERIITVRLRTRSLHATSDCVGFREYAARLRDEAVAHGVDVVYATGYLNDEVMGSNDEHAWTAYLSGADQLPRARVVNAERARLF